MAQTAKNLPANAKNAGSVPGLERSPGEGNGYPLQYSRLENPMDRGAWWATVHGVTKNQTGLGTNTHTHTHTHTHTRSNSDPSFGFALLCFLLHFHKGCWIASTQRHPEHHLFTPSPTHPLQLLLLLLAAATRAGAATSLLRALLASAKSVIHTLARN